MKKRFLSFFLTLCMLADFLPARAYGGAWAGEGTSGSPYEIADEDDLKALADRVNAGETFEDTYFELTWDIDLNGGYTFTFVPATGLVAVNDGASDVFFLGTGICGTLSGDQFETTASVTGGYYYLDSADGTYAAISSAAEAAARSYVVNADDRIVRIYGADAMTYDTLNFWTPIGVSADGAQYFQGDFDGNGKTVSGLFISDTASDDLGLFGMVKSAGLRNLGVTGYLAGGACTGAVTGYDNGGSTIENCKSAATVCGTSNIGGIAGKINSGSAALGCENSGTVNGGGGTGGIVGLNYGGSVRNCINSGPVSGYKNAQGVGGIAGGSSGGTIINCANSGPVSGGANSSYFGGIVGHGNCAAVMNSYNLGDVSCVSYVGGIAGHLECSLFEVATIENCYSIGSVTGSGKGGIVGELFDSVVRYCYWLKTAQVSSVYGVQSGGTPDGCGYVTAADGTITPEDEQNPYVTSGDATLAEALEAWVEDTNLPGCNTWITGGETDFAVFSDEWVPETFTFYYYSSDGGTLLSTSSALLRQKTMCLSDFEPESTGELFAGWALEANSETASYQPGGDYLPDYEALADPKPTELSLYAVWATPWTGGGTQTSPYLIADAEGLRALAALTTAGRDFENTYFELTGDIDLNGGYAFPFVPETGLVAVNDGASDVFFLGTGICGTLSGNQFASTPSTKGGYYYLDSAVGTYAAISSAAEAAARSYVVDTDIQTVTVYGADTSIFCTLSLWTPIGTSGSPFPGIFDGGGKTVKGIYINNTAKSYQGLFGYVNSTTIRDLSVDGFIAGGNFAGGIAGGILCTVERGFNFATVCGGNNVGGIAGSGSGGDGIRDCGNRGAVYGVRFVGGVLGNSGSSVNNCANSGSVNGKLYTGGIVGANMGTLRNCSNEGPVTSTASGSSDTGGVAGRNEDGTVQNCFNSGPVSGLSNVGGVVGYNNGMFDGFVENCYNRGGVTGSGDTGAVAGAGNGTVGYCYWLKTAEVCPTLGASGSGGAGGCGYITAADGYITLVDTADTTYVPSGTVKLTEALEAWVEAANLAELDTWVADSVTGFPVFSSTLVPKTFTFCYYSSDGGTLLSSSTASLWRGSMLLSSFQPDEMGRVFLGWATEADSETVTYLPGSDYKPDYDALADPKPDSLSLYAVWDYLWTGSGTADEPYLISGAEGLKELSERNETGETFSGIYFALTQNISLNEGYTFTFNAATGLVAVNDGSADVFYLGTGIPGSESGNQFEETASAAGGYYYQNGGTYTSMSSSNSAQTRKYVIYDESVTVYGADAATSYTLNTWTPIGGYQYLDALYFEGIFNGNGKTVSGLFINNTDHEQGLFGVTDGAQISNLNVTGFVKGGDYYTGAVVGCANEHSTIENCASAAVVCGTRCVGGVAGSLTGGSAAESCENTGVVSGSMFSGGVSGYLVSSASLKNSANAGIVSGSGETGGIAGGQNGGTVENCENTGRVNGYGNTGGIVGYLYDYGTVKNCENSGCVTGLSMNYGESSENIGGIAGKSENAYIYGCANSGSVDAGYNIWNVGGIAGYSGDGQISNCSSSGTVSGAADAERPGNYCGGIVGYGDCVRVINNYNTGAVSGYEYIGGIAGWIGSGSTGSEGLIENCYSLGSVTGQYKGMLAGGLDAPVKYCYWLKTAETDSYFGEISCAPVGCGYVTSADGYITPDGESPYVTGTTVTLTEALEAWVEDTNLECYDTWVTDSATGIPVFSSPWVPETFVFRYYSADGGTLIESETIELRLEDMLIMSAEPEQAGKVFSGWAASANSAAVTYLPGEDYGSVYDVSDPKPASLSLYAVWEDPAPENGSVTKLFASGGASAAPSYITDGQDPDSLENGGYDIVMNSGYDGSAYTYGNPQNVGVSFTVGTGEGEVAAPGQSARLVIYAYDVKELVEFDTVWLVDETLSKTYRVGQISGGANAWNSTALPVPQCLLAQGHSYHLKFSIQADVIYIRSVYLFIDGGEDDGGNITGKSVSLSYTPGTLAATTSLTAAAASGYTLEYKVSALWEDNNTNQLRKAAGSITTAAAGETGTDTQSFSITPNSRFLYQLDVIVKKDSVPVAVITRVFTAYTYTYNLNGVSGTAPAGGGVLLGNKLAEPADPEATGFAFLGWYADAACTDAWEFGADTVSSNMTLYAGWSVLGGGAALELSSISLDGGIVSVSVKNKTDTDLSASVVAAAYDSHGRMLGVKLLEVTAAKNSTQNLTADFFGLTGLSNVKAFLLYGEESRRPLCGSLSAAAE